MTRITIIGLGLIGGSIGLALKRAGWEGLEVIGYARSPQTASRALELGAVDRVESSPEKAIAGAELVIVATPALAIKEVLEQIAARLPSGCTVTDTASTKVQVMRWAEECLPQRTTFIGGHPMAGREFSGIDYAQASLFDGCNYCLTLPSNPDRGAVDLVKKLVETVGAKPILIDASTHDRLVAAVSHLPFLISTALASATTGSPHWHAMSRLAATGYRDLTRLASGNPRMYRDICLTNQGEIRRWTDEFIESLRDLQAQLNDGDKLERAFASARDARERWLRGKESESRLGNQL